MLALTLNIANASINMTLFGLVRQRRDRTLIVRPIALANEGHGSITLEIGYGDNRSIHWKLLIVGTETVTVGIGIGEETRL